MGGVGLAFERAGLEAVADGGGIAVAEQPGELEGVAAGGLHRSRRGGAPRVQESRRGCTVLDARAGITTNDQESRGGPRAYRTGCLSRDNATAGLSNAPTNSRLLQHFTTNLPRRWPEHLAGGYDPITHRNRGPGSRLLAAALHAGCTVELVRVWYGSQARALEQRLKQRRKPGSLRAGAAGSLKPLCPVCNPAGWWRRYPDLPDPAPPPPRRRFVHDPAVWDATAEWNLAFPALAYPDPAAMLQVGGLS